MSTYVETMASIFHSFRLDNAHGTPIHVSEYMVDKARAVRPNLYICAELFTGSPWKDVHYSSKLGINALVREAMQVCHSRHYATLVDLEHSNIYIAAHEHLMQLSLGK